MRDDRVSKKPLLEEIVDADPADVAPSAWRAARGNGPLVAECVTEKHPTLLGRIFVRWETGTGEVAERWCPTLHGMAVRAGDRVVIQWPVNWAEPIVVGVLDGFAVRPEIDRNGPTVELATDEELRVTDERGQLIAAIKSSPNGPVVRLLSADTNLELEGALRVSAREIEMRANAGELKLQAADDVVVKGEIIHLN